MPEGARCVECGGPVVEKERFVFQRIPLGVHSYVQPPDQLGGNLPCGHDALAVWLDPEGEFRLDLGCGYSPAEGFVGVDPNPGAGAAICAPAFPLPWLDDESVEELRAVDVLEHLSYWLTGEVVFEWARVLRPGGKLFVQVPDAVEIMHRFVASEMGGTIARARLLRGIPKELYPHPHTPLMGVTWRLLGGQGDGRYVRGDDDWRLNAHYALFSEDSLRDVLTSMGFAVDSIERNEHPNLLAHATKRDRS